MFLDAYSVTTSLGPYCMRIVTSCKEVYQDETRRACKGSVVLAFIATFVVFEFVTCSVGRRCCSYTSASTRCCSRNEGRTACSPRQTSGRRLGCAGGTHSGWPSTGERRSLHGKCERGEDADGRNALQRVFGSACSDHSHREGRRNFCSGTCMQSRQRFLHQLGDTPVLYQSAATARRKSGRWRNEAKCFELEKTAHRKTRMGSRVWASGWTRRVAGGPGNQFDFRECIACQWGRWSDDPSFPHNRGGKTLFRSVPLPLDVSLDRSTEENCVVGGTIGAGSRQNCAMCLDCRSPGATMQ